MGKQSWLDGTPVMWAAKACRAAPPTALQRLSVSRPARPAPPAHFYNLARHPAPPLQALPELLKHRDCLLAGGQVAQSALATVLEGMEEVAKKHAHIMGLFHACLALHIGSMQIMRVHLHKRLRNRKVRGRGAEESARRPVSCIAGTRGRHGRGPPTGGTD